MNTADLPLKDIHLPTDVSFWPLAPGWWLLIAIACAIMALLVWQYFRRRPQARHLAFRPQALQLLDQYEQAFAHHANPQQLAQQVNQLLRRVAMTSGHTEAARLTGQAWFDFIKQQDVSDALPSSTETLLVQQPYTDLLLLPAPTIAQCLPPLRQWINHFPGASRSVDV